MKKVKYKYFADIHAHFYANKHLLGLSKNLPYKLPQPYSLQQHIDGAVSLGFVPYLVCNVHLSILPTSKHVTDSLDEMAELRKTAPGYDQCNMLGFIKAEPEYASDKNLDYPGVKGVRLVLHDTKPDAFDENIFKQQPWEDMFNRLIRRNHHFLIYATNPTTVLKVVSCLPEEMYVGIDHLGNCERDADDRDFGQLLELAKEREKIYFKGPGYRAHPNVGPLAIMRRIVKVLGFDKLLIGATDNPNVGSDPSGQVYNDLFPDLADVVGYTDRLAQRLGNETNVNPLYFLLINSCKTYNIPLPKGIIAYPFNKKQCVMFQEEFEFQIENQNMRGNIYYPINNRYDGAIFINCSGFTGLEHIHPQRFARALTTFGHISFSFDYRGFGQNEWLSEIGRVRLDAQIQEIEAAVELIRHKFPKRKIILNGWGMAGGLVIKAAVNLAKRDITVTAVTGENGFYDNETIQQQVRGKDGYQKYCAWFEQQTHLRETEGDKIDIDPFDAYPLAPKTREYVDKVLRKQTGYERMTHVDFEFAKQLRAFKITEDDLTTLVKANIAIHISHGEDNDIHPISQADQFYQLARQNISFHRMSNCNHTDFMHDDDPRFIQLINTLAKWTQTSISPDKSVISTHEERTIAKL